MGLIAAVLAALFGSGRNVVKETAEVFLPNAEAAEMRDTARASAALAQFAAEFVQPKRGIFDRFMDGLNRLPRPMLALGTLGLLVAAMVDPVWFAARMQGIALVPEPLWWLMGAIVSFYFGARQQTKVQDFQKGLAETLSRAPAVAANIGALEALRAGAGGLAEAAAPDAGPDGNAALEDWRQTRDR